MSGNAAAPVAEGRVERKRRAARLRLLHTGLKLVGTHRAEHVAVSDLCAAADCSVGAFYTHFASKEAFVEVLAHEAIEPIGNALDAFGNNQRTAAEAVSAGLRFTLELAMRNPDWGRFVIAEAWSGRALSSGLGGRATRDLERGRREKVFDFEDLGAATAVVSGAFISGVLLATNGQMTSRTAAATASYVLRALGVPIRRAAAITAGALPVLDIDAEFAGQLLQSRPREPDRESASIM